MTGRVRGSFAAAVLIAAGAPAALAQTTQAQSPRASPPAAITPAGAPIAPESVEIARHILDIAYPPALRPMLFEGVTRSIAEQTRQAALAGVTDPGLRALIERKTATIAQRLQPITAQHVPAFIGGYARAYARQFSADELRQILAFAQTPAGAHFMTRSPFLLSDPDIVAANREYITEARTVQQQVVTELVQEGRAYIAKHPEAAPKPAAAAAPPAQPATGK